ncbi:N-acetyltransferase [Humisphaera borealis]|uniref:N-acetyltransferase domain-containing protein n=1 Tax=Humisphaera borealis TaxID=2807512 RepID=A0A7M2X3V5_9BACT|nr:hypothetical protein [Humisphaera borealis]QOV92122.1 hypothetical protein IPV69_12505 [Humisphaera borealis]
MTIINELAFDFDVEEDDFNLEATLDGMWVCRALGTREGDRLRLEDMQVRPDVEVPKALLKQVGTLRGNKIGTEVLRRFLRRADAEGVREIFGSVTQKDIEENRDLLGWYRREGFEVTVPDGDCLDHAGHKIVRRR